MLKLCCFETDYFLFSINMNILSEKLNDLHYPNELYIIETESIELYKYPIIFFGNDTKELEKYKRIIICINENENITTNITSNIYKWNTDIQIFLNNISPFFYIRLDFRRFVLRRLVFFPPHLFLFCSFKDSFSNILLIFLYDFYLWSS
jgi:hypothetical protein